MITSGSVVFLGDKVYLWHYTEKKQLERQPFPGFHHRALGASSQIADKRQAKLILRTAGGNVLLPWCEQLLKPATWRLVHAGDVSQAHYDMGYYVLLS